MCVVDNEHKLVAPRTTDSKQAKKLVYPNILFKLIFKKKSISAIMTYRRLFTIDE